MSFYARRRLNEIKLSEETKTSVRSSSVETDKRIITIDPHNVDIMTIESTSCTQRIGVAEATKRVANARKLVPIIILDIKTDLFKKVLCLGSKVISHYLPVSMESLEPFCHLCHICFSKESSWEFTIYEEELRVII